MLDQAVFNFSRADAVARRLEHVVGAALVPKVAVLVGHGHVARAAPVTCVFGLRGFVVVPVAQKEHRVGLAVHIEAVHRHFAGRAGRAQLTRLVDDRHLVPWIPFAHAARFGRPQAGAVAHHVVDLGLAKHLVDRDAHLLLDIRKYRVTHRLARAHHGLQFQAVAALHLGHSLHHGFERGGEQKGVRDAVALQNFEGRFGRKPPVEGHDGPAKVEAGQQGVHQPARPGPVGRRPEHGFRGLFCLERVKAKPILAAHKAREVTDQCPVRNQGPLGVAGGATGVDQHRRFFSPSGHGFERARAGRHGWGQVQIGQGARFAHPQQRLQTGAIGSGLQQGLHSGFIAHRHARLAVVDAK